MKKRWPTIQPWISTLLRLGLAAVFFYAGVTKIPDPGESVRSVRAYDVLPEWLNQAVGYGLPIVEVLLALFLLLGLFTRIAAIVSALLLVVFIVGIAQAAARGLSIDCGCFGSGGEIAKEDTKYTWEIIRDSLFLLGSLFLIKWPLSKFALDRHVRRFFSLNPPATERSQ